MSAPNQSRVVPPSITASLVCAILSAASLVRGQTTLSGNSFALKSSGAANGSAWTLNSNGYLGTYITLNAPGSISILLNASGQSSAGISPQMTLSIADFN